MSLNYTTRGFSHLPLAHVFAFATRPLDSITRRKIKNTPTLPIRQKGPTPPMRVLMGPNYTAHSAHSSHASAFLW